MPDQAELALDAKAKLGEGAIWDSRQQRLYWVDIEQNRLHVTDPTSGSDEVHDLGQMISTVAPRRSGGVVVALHHGLGAYDLHARKLSVFCDPNAHNPDIRFNDGKCDPSGRFWAGTLGMNKDGGKPIGALFRLDPDHRVQQIVDSVVCSNGIVWTSDRSTMYYIDSCTFRIDAFNYENATGRVFNRRPVITTQRDWGYPDGMTIDSEDHLWVAFWGGYCVRCIDPRSGQVLHKLSVPVPQVTSCAFGGENLDQLYITTAWSSLNDALRAAHPQSGGLFVARPGARGVPAFEFAG